MNTLAAVLTSSSGQAWLGINVALNLLICAFAIVGIYTVIGHIDRWRMLRYLKGRPVITEISDDQKKKFIEHALMTARCNIIISHLYTSTDPKSSSDVIVAQQWREIVRRVRGNRKTSDDLSFDEVRQVYEASLVSAIDQMRVPVASLNELEQRIGITKKGNQLP